MHFQNVYWDQVELSNANLTASILAIGDSWFWYPFPGGSLLNALGPVVATKQQVIFAVGNNGAEAYDYVHGVYKTQVATALKFHGAGLSAVFVSGGGNDFAGFNDLRPLLKHDCTGITTARGCFRTKPGEPLDQLMSRTEKSIEDLVKKVLKEAREGTEVFLHTYDNAIPTGKGLFGGNSSWLKQALDDAKVAPNLQRPCVIFLINEFAKRLQAIRKRYPNRVFLIDSRGTLTQNDWANELHPTPGGFRKIAQQAWRPVLRSRGLCT